MLHSLKEYTDHVLEFKTRRPFVSFQFTLHIMNSKQSFAMSWCKCCIHCNQLIQHLQHDIVIQSILSSDKKNEDFYKAYLCVMLNEVDNLKKIKLS